LFVQSPVNRTVPAGSDFVPVPERRTFPYTGEAETVWVSPDEFAKLTVLAGLSVTVPKPVGNEETEAVPDARRSVAPAPIERVAPAAPVMEYAVLVVAVRNIPPAEIVRFPAREVVVRFLCCVTPAALLIVRCRKLIAVLVEIFCAAVPSYSNVIVEPGTTLPGLRNGSGLPESGIRRFAPAVKDSVRKFRSMKLRS
jgi:hypothetical protein